MFDVETERTLALREEWKEFHKENWGDMKEEKTIDTKALEIAAKMLSHDAMEWLSDPILIKKNTPGWWLKYLRQKAVGR